MLVNTIFLFGRSDAYYSNRTGVAKYPASQGCLSDPKRIPLMKSIFSILLAALACCANSVADTVYSNPMGFVSVTCPRNSDTIVGLPLRQAADFTGTLSANPDTVTIPDSAILSLIGTPGLTVDAFAGTHYVKFKDSTPTALPGDGQWFAVVSNTADTITLDLNGDVIDSVSGAELEVLKFWTLGELFPPAECTTDPLTTGTAIVASTNLFASGLRTQVLYPNLNGSGINLAPSVGYFLNGASWRRSDDKNNNYNDTVLLPGTYFIIRHPAAVTSNTTYTVSGEVDGGSFVLPLATLGGGSQDNFIALPRAVDITLNDLGLGGSAAFMSSTSYFASGLRDQLLVYDNSLQVANKAPSAGYYYYGGWRKSGGGSSDRGSDVIPAGAGFVIRKYQSGDGFSDFWTNTPNY